MVAQTQNNIIMISYYKIPKNVKYVQFATHIEQWEKVSGIQYDVPTVAIIEDSKVARPDYPTFVVIYKGMVQQRGGSGSCYNPLSPEHMINPMDNSTMPGHMGRWKPFSHILLLQLVVAAKYAILEKMGYKKYDETSDKPTRLPYWYSNCEHYNTIPGILIAQLDLIGMGKADCSIIKEGQYRKKLLLTA